MREPPAAREPVADAESSIGESLNVADDTSINASFDVTRNCCTKDTGVMTASEQRAYLELLQRGGSSAAVCRKLEIEPERVRRTQRECGEFAAACREVVVQLSQNVAAALYQAAMKGSVPAQALWLKHVPPPEWVRVAGGTEDDVVAGDDDGSQRRGRDYAELSDDELVQLARKVGIDIPAELASRGA